MVSQAVATSLGAVRQPVEASPSTAPQAHLAGCTQRHLSPMAHRRFPRFTVTSPLGRRRIYRHLTERLKVDTGQLGIDIPDPRTAPGVSRLGTPLSPFTGPETPAARWPSAPNKPNCLGPNIALNVDSITAYTAIGPRPRQKEQSQSKPISSRQSRSTDHLSEKPGPRAWGTNKPNSQVPCISVNGFPGVLYAKTGLGPRSRNEPNPNSSQARASFDRQPYVSYTEKFLE